MYSDLKKQLSAIGVKTYVNNKTKACFIKKSDLETVLAKVSLAEVDEVAKRELNLFIDNDYQLYTSKMMPMYKNLSKKMKNGSYDSKQAPKLFKYLVEEGAKKYAKEFADPKEWNTLFDKKTRDSLAEDYAKEFEEAYENKEHDFMKD